MKYKAEIFDKILYLFEVIKYNDHQLHCVLRFSIKIDASVMEKAINLLLKAVPILACRYVQCEGKSYWQSVDASRWKDIFSVVYDIKHFNSFTISKTNEITAPQIKVCLLSAEKDSLSIIMNHMICDAAGFKQCLYLLSQLYSNLIKDPGYLIEHTIDGDRSIQNIIKQIKLTDRIRTLVFKGSEGNQNGNYKFPMSGNGNTQPFILTCQIFEDRYETIKQYCNKMDVTINDVILTAYYRVISDILKVKDKEINIPIMVDMRRYLPDKCFTALSNLSSNTDTKIIVNNHESFDSTLKKVHKEMDMIKADHIGLNWFIILSYVFKLLNSKISYNVTKDNLKNPYICMTNIGVIDSNKLIFSESSVTNAFMCGSIKYRPHFQLALSSFKNQITFSVNLYGSQEDKDTIEPFFLMLKKEIEEAAS